MSVLEALFDADALHAEDPLELPLLGPGGRAFTAAQAAAISDRSRSLLLSANAGSGKTSVLVERFVRAVLEDRLDPARVLAITFTERAAGELRERVRARFLELGARDEARATEGAFISTIHGFCARLLRAHPLAAGLDPGFRVLDEPRAARLRESAFARALAALLAGERPGALDLVAAYGPDRLRDALLTAYDALRSDGQTAPRLPVVAAGPAPADERAALQRARATFAAELVTAREGKAVVAARAALDRCAELLGDHAAAVDVPWPATLEALKAPGGTAAALRTDACRAYGEAREAYARACADHHATRAVVLLDELLAGFGEAYATAKRARGVLDFDDLELGARDLLAAHPGVRHAWSERFALVMVDEFQDTNRRQLALLEALERENLLTVGDELQSIYGFRHADVSILRGRRRTLAARGAALELAESFRSRREVLSVLDAVFGARFGPGFVPLVPARSEPPDGAARVELLLTDARGWEDVDLGETLPAAPAARRAEARLVAQRVRELVDAGEARAGQVAVLVRASAAMPLFERALADVGLSTLATAGRGFWSRQEVVDLLAYLAAVANPLDEVALVGALASPLAGVSPDALALAAMGARERGGGLWRTLEAAFVEGERASWSAELEPDDAAAFAAFVPRLAAERRQASLFALDELLERAIEASHYDLHLLGLLDGARRRANVDKLLRLARDFEAAEGRDLRALLDHAAVLEQAQPREPEAALDDPDEDAVRLMTIHAAKGLEFDVTVVADLGRRGNLQTPDLLVADGRVGLRLALLDGAPATPALAYDELRERRYEAEAREEDRVLYVALTRARERLVLSGTLDPDRVPRDAPGCPPLAWLAGALVPDAPARLREASPERAVATLPVHGAAPAAGCALLPEGGSPAVAPSLAAPAPVAPVRVVLSSPATLGAALRDDLLTGAPARGAPVQGDDLQASSDEEPAACLPPAPLASRSSSPPPLASRSSSSPPLATPPTPSSPLPLAASPPLAPPSLPSALSYTALTDYARCALRFHAQRVLGLPDAAVSPTPRPSASRPPRAGGLDARQRGVVVHALLEELDLARPAAPSAERVGSLAASLGTTVREADVAHVQRLVATFATSALRERLAAAPRLRREHGFAFELEPGRGPLLTGVVDLLALEADGTWLVVDPKTDRLAREEEPAALVAREYGLQRRLYALAALRAGAPRVEVAHVLLERADRPVLVAFTAADEPRLAASLRVLTEPIAAGRFPATDRPHAALCATCPARGTVCPHPVELTLRPEAQAESAPPAAPAPAPTPAPTPAPAI